MKRWFYLSFAGALLMATAACSDDERDARCPALIGGGNYCLQPSTTIAPFEVQQKVEIRFRGQHETMIAELEVNDKGMRLVGLTPFGQTLLKISYDNRAITTSKLPDSRLPPGLLIALLQLALWPANALRTGLEAPLILEESAVQRRILNRDKVILTINYTGDQPPYRRIKMVIHAEDIELDVETL